MFVFNDVMNDDIKYFKWHTASTNVTQVAAQFTLTILEGATEGKRYQSKRKRQRMDDSAGQRWVTN